VEEPDETPDAEEAETWGGTKLGSSVGKNQRLKRFSGIQSPWYARRKRLERHLCWYIVSEVFVNEVCDEWNGTVDRAIMLYRLRADHDMRGMMVSWLNTFALRMLARWGGSEGGRG